MRHRPGHSRALIAAACALSPALAFTHAHASAVQARPGAATVTVTVTGLRSTKGRVLACLTARPRAFPKCENDPEARSAVVPAAAHVELDFGTVPSGRYAISLIHDENSNGKLDTSLMIPREGFGFSRDAPVRMGPPSFAAAAFTVEGESQNLAIRMRYLQ